jgi:ABC-type multidrug transport system ATPase subunit
VTIVARGLAFSHSQGRPTLQGIALDAPAGLCLVLGGNGAGKSTLLRLLAGVERPDAGSVEIGGVDLWRDEVRARAALAYVPEQPDLPPHATVGETLRLVAALRGEDPGAARQALEAVGLPDTLLSRPSQELSTGQSRRVHLAAARLGDPRVLLLDEPMEALDRTTRDGVVAWLGARVAAGATALVVTHDLEPFVALATRALALRDGRAGSVEVLPEDPAARLARLEILARG